MKLKIYQVDAFASNIFEGNPAAVCPLTEWLDDELLQKIAEENNLSETAFFVMSEQSIHLRWFTPMEEVDLCGHATLATAYVLYEYLGFTKPEVTFLTKSGELTVSKNIKGFSMDFPASMPHTIEAPQALLQGLGSTVLPKQVMAAFDYVVVLNSEEEVRSLTPDFAKWLELDLRGVVITAEGNKADFVSRSFFPKLRVNEDPVTGSAHCEIAPYWEQQLAKSVLTGQQVSKRSGAVLCEVKGNRVMLTGQAVGYMVGEIFV
ncbi:PhzF family phenazine biosynthesis protein [Colwellia sp. UCD-KL20]|uniref:PhzF family phenazine biosynthesis protein n=1 Tax=Colwellia sp. UCD-KL20 TaxID=1917165 RepID=UPI000970918F|nr:PhzF family phenazine biosynthesis protein [Colwellia sp. UCD-KL20]